MATRRYEVPAEQRAALITALRRGTDFLAALDDAKVDLADARRDRGFMYAAGQAFRSATGRMRTKLLRGVLTNDESGRLYVLEREIANREVVAKQFPAETVEVDEDGNDWAPILSKLSTDELEVLEGLMTGDGSALATLIEGRARALAEEMVKAQRAEAEAKIAAEPDRQSRARLGNLLSSGKDEAWEAGYFSRFAAPIPGGVGRPARRSDDARGRSRG
jgi:hypothetical protein